MKYELFFPTHPDQLEHQVDNLDVCVTLENGAQYTLTVATTECVKRLMAQDGTAYLRPGMPMLFAESLTEACIRQLLDELVLDTPLLRLYGSDLSE